MRSRSAPHTITARATDLAEKIGRIQGSGWLEQRLFCFLAASSHSFRLAAARMEGKSEKPSTVASEIVQMAETVVGMVILCDGSKP